MKIQAKTHPGGVCLVLSGRLDFNSRHVFQESVGAREEARVWLDLGGVDYINSCGLGLLSLLAEEYAAARRKLFIVNAKGTVAEVLRLANLHKRIPMSDD